MLWEERCWNWRLDMSPNTLACKVRGLRMWNFEVKETNNRFHKEHYRAVPFHHWVYNVLLNILFWDFWVYNANLVHAADKIFLLIFSFLFFLIFSLKVFFSQLRISICVHALIAWPPSMIWIQLKLRVLLA